MFERLRDVLWENLPLNSLSIHELLRDFVRWIKWPRFQVIVSGKLRGQRAKSMKFVDGLMIHSGHPVNEYIQQAVRHVQLRQGWPISVVSVCIQYAFPNPFQILKCTDIIYSESPEEFLKKITRKL